MEKLISYTITSEKYKKLVLLSEGIYNTSVIVAYFCNSKAEIIGLSSIRLNGLTCFCHRIPNRIHHYLGKSSSFY